MQKQIIYNQYILHYLSLFLLFAIGCSKSSIPKESLLSASPAIIDFGTVRPSDSLIELNFDFYNNSNTNVVIKDIYSGCGCTHIDIPKEPIPPKGITTIPFVLDVWGRSGIFENELIIKTTASGDLHVPIRGKIESDIWTSGQSLRCTYDPQKQRAVAILTVYTDKFPDIVFSDTSQEDIVITEISRENKYGTTAIRFSVEVLIEPHTAMIRTITIVPADSSIAPLAIPLHCRRE